MTVIQAISEGYTHFFYEKEGYQPMKELADVELKDIDAGIHLVEKESYHPSGLSAEDILEQIAEQIHCQHGDESGDDTEDVYDALKTIDPSVLQPFVDAIGQKLSAMNYYKGTNIKLTSIG